MEVYVKEIKKEGETGFSTKLKFHIPVDQSEILSMHNLIKVTATADKGSDYFISQLYLPV